MRPGHPGRRPVLAVAAIAVALLGGCGSTGPPAPLRTAAAERASWPRSPADAVPAGVERVVDGDTFVAVVGGRRDPVRVIGVDTPETVAPGRPVERYGRQASAFAERWLGGATVRLAGDVEPRDRYGRLLAYVWLPDGTFWNALLAAEGYAEQLTIPPNIAFAELFDRLVAEARARHRGLWAAAGDHPAAAGSAAPGDEALRGPPLPLLVMAPGCGPPLPLLVMAPRRGLRGAPPRARRGRRRRARRSPMPPRRRRWWR